MTPEQRINELVAVARKFSEFLDQENEMLGAREVTMPEEHLKQKDILARTYEGHVKAISEYIDELGNLDPEKRDNVLEIGNELKEKIAKNVIRLRARYEANLMLMDSYAKAVTETSSGAGTYENSGKIINGSTRDKERPLAATLNQSL